MIRESFESEYVSEISYLSIKVVERVVVGTKNSKYNCNRQTLLSMANDYIT